MVISRKAAAELEGLEEAAQRNVGAGIGTGLVRVDGGLLGLRSGIEGEADWHAIFAVVTADRDADIEIAIDISEPAGDVVGAPRRIGQLVLQLGKGAELVVGAGKG